MARKITPQEECMICGTFPCTCAGMSRKNTVPDAPRRKQGVPPAKGNPPKPPQTVQNDQCWAKSLETPPDPSPDTSDSLAESAPPASPWGAALEKRAEHDQQKAAEDALIVLVQRTFPGAAIVKERP